MTIYLSVVEDELLLVVLLMERRFVFSRMHCPLILMLKAKWVLLPTDSSCSGTTVTGNVSLRCITSDGTVTLKNRFEMTKWTS